MSLARLYKFFQWISQHFYIPPTVSSFVVSSIKALQKSPYALLFLDVLLILITLPLVLFLQLGSGIYDYSFMYILKNSVCFSLCGLGFLTLFQTYAYPLKTIDFVHFLKQVSAIILCTMTFVPLTVLLSHEEELPGLSLLFSGIVMLILTFVPRVATWTFYYICKKSNIPLKTPLIDTSKLIRTPSFSTLPTAVSPLSPEEQRFFEGKKIVLLNGHPEFLKAILNALSPSCRPVITIIHSSWDDLQAVRDYPMETGSIKTHVCPITDHSLLESLIEKATPNLLLCCAHPTWMGEENLMHYLRHYILSTEFLSFVIHKYHIPQAALFLKTDPTNNYIPLIKASFMRFSTEGSSQYLLLMKNLIDDQGILNTPDDILSLGALKSFYALQHARDVLEYELFNPASQKISPDYPHAQYNISSYDITPHEYTAWIHTPYLEELLQAIDQCDDDHILKILEKYKKNAAQKPDHQPSLSERDLSPTTPLDAPANDILSSSPPTREAS